MDKNYFVRWKFIGVDKWQQTRPMTEITIPALVSYFKKCKCDVKVLKMVKGDIELIEEYFYA